MKPVDIVATGARTPIGLRSATSAAALRAGIMRVRESPRFLTGDGEPVAGCVDMGLDPSTSLPHRLVAMLHSALREACAPWAPRRPSCPRLPLYLALPEPRPGFTSADARAVQHAIARLPLPVTLDPVNVAAQGHAAGLSLLEHAITRIDEGLDDACILGGADSYFDEDTLRWLERNRQLASARVRAGFVPGEGAAACVLMSPLTSRAIGIAPLATVGSVATAWEVNRAKTSAVCTADGLTEVVERALGVVPSGTSIDEILCDINGERYRSEEWGFVALKSWHHNWKPTSFRSPADVWGDMGAASAPLMMMLAGQAAQRGYARGPTTLIWASSEQGLRGAAVLTAPVRSRREDTP